MADTETTTPDPPAWQLTEAQYKHLAAKLDSLERDMNEAKTREQRDKVRAKMNDIQHKLDAYEDEDEDEDKDEDEDEGEDEDEDEDDDDDSGTPGSRDHSSAQRNRRTRARTTGNKTGSVKPPGRNKKTRDEEKKTKKTAEPPRGAFAAWRKQRT